MTIRKTIEPLGDGAPRTDAAKVFLKACRDNLPKLDLSDQSEWRKTAFAFETAVAELICEGWKEIANGAPDIDALASMAPYSLGSGIATAMAGNAETFDGSLDAFGQVVQATLERIAKLEAIHKSNAALGAEGAPDGSNLH